VVSLVAVVGFYTVYVLVVRGIRPRSVSEFVHLALVSGARWLVLGAVSGPVFGVLGGWWQRRRSLVAGLLAASLLLFEPPAWLVWTLDSVHYPVVWGVEIALGVLAPGQRQLGQTLGTPRAREVAQDAAVTRERVTGLALVNWSGRMRA
jgi:hypothetical protein